MIPQKFGFEDVAFLNVQEFESGIQIVSQSFTPFGVIKQAEHKIEFQLQHNDNGDTPYATVRIHNAPLLIYRKYTLKS